MSSSRSSPYVPNSRVHSTFDTQFGSFAPKAWLTYKGENNSDWARVKAREFLHTVNNKIPFVLVYNSLIQFINIMQNDKKSSRSRTIVSDLHEAEDSGEEYEGEDSEEDEENVPHSSALQRDTRLVNAITPAGRQTAAEERYARNELNRTLFREF